MTICGTLPPISLVPGDSWDEVVQINDQAGQPIDLSNWTISLVELRKRGASAILSLGAGTLQIDTAALGEGRIGIKADAADTGVVRAMGERYELEIEGISPDGAVKTLYFGSVVYVEIATTNIITVNHIGFQGAAGRSVLIVETAAELVPGFGIDGDSAVVAETGIVWRKVNGAWATTGVQFIGSLLPDTIAARDKAKQWAEEDEDVEVEPGAYSSKHHALKAAASDGSAAASASASAGSAANAMGSETAAAQSKDDAAVLAGQALGYKDEASVFAATTAGLKASVDQSVFDLYTLIGTLPDLSGVTASLMGKAVRLLAAADIVASCWWISSADEMKAIRRGEKARSYYNEPLNTATRGSRREMPQAKLIVARSVAGSTSIGHVVTIHDMDNGGAMWAVFNGGGSFSLTVPNSNAAITSVSAAAGRVGVGLNGTGALCLWDFIADETITRVNDQNGYYPRNIAGRNTAVSTVLPNYFPAGLVSRAVNSVAAYVAPGMPVDPIRRLPNPTIAVGTAGGVSVIHPDGRVTNSGYNAAIVSVCFAPDGTLFYSTALGAMLFSPPAEYASAGFAQRLYNDNTTPRFPASSGGSSLVPLGGRWLARGSNVGLHLLQHEPGSGIAVNGQNNRSGQTFITRDFNTGRMYGNTLYCGAESTRDQTNLVADVVLSTNFTNYADQAAMEADGWVFTGCTASIVTGKLRLTSTVASGAVYADKTGGSTTIARKYAIASSATSVSGGRNGQIALRNPGDTTTRAQTGAAGSAGFSVLTGSLDATFAESPKIRILVVSPNAIGNSVDFGDVVVRSAASDRSAAGNNPIVVGTVGRTPVATNAELCACRPQASSGFEHASSILAAAGAGDFTIRGWLAGDNAGTSQTLLLARNAADSSNSFFITRGTSSGNAQLTLRVPGASDLTSVTGFKDAIFKPVTVVRRSGTVELWVGDTREATGTSSTNLTGIFASVLHSLKDSVNAAAASMQLALGWRIGPSAWTPAQIRAANADEAKMFAPGAKILLTGSGSVNQPGYDKGTGSLYVPQTTGGTDVFVGPCRIATRNIASVGAAMTSDNHKAVVAENENVAFITANEVYVETPTIGLREALTRKDAEQPYDRTVVKLPSAGVTTNALSTVIARLPMGKDEAGDWTIRTTGLEWGDPASPAFGDFEDKVHAYRPGEGNIIVGTSLQRVIQRSVVTIAVTISANTTAQTVDVAVVGENPKNIEWGVTATFSPTKEQAAA